MSKNAGKTTLIKKISIILTTLFLCALIPNTTLADYTGFWDSGQAISVTGQLDSEGVALGDFDKDGDLDAFVVNFGKSSLVWHNNGAGSFTVGQTLAVVQGATGVVVADFDGDGDLDAFVTNAIGNDILYRNDSGTFTDVSTGQFTGATSYGVATGDFDGDGTDLDSDGEIDTDFDLFVANAAGTNKVYRNDGNFVFTEIQSIGTASTNVALGDLDGDGDLDAFVTKSGNANVVWENDGSSTPFTNSITLSNTLKSWSVALGDFNGDGKLDAFVANEFNGNVDTANANVVWQNTGTGAAGNFSFTQTQQLGDLASEGVALYDFDGDNDLDAFVGNTQAKNNEVWLNNGGNLGLGQTVGGVTNSYSSTTVAVGDLDGDGDFDVFVANKTAANRVWFYNNPPVITAQANNALNTNEGVALTIAIADVTANDPDNGPDNPLTKLQVQASNSYNLNGNEITPTSCGTIYVPVVVNDRISDSVPFELAVTVTETSGSCNTAPVIDAQQVLTTPECTPLTIELTNLTVTDDNTYPADFTLKVLDGTNYTHTEAVITPVNGYIGTLTVPVRVNDGFADSNTFNLSVTVTDTGACTPTTPTTPITPITPITPAPVFVPAAATYVTATTTTGTFSAGSVIEIIVKFSKTVWVSGTPQLLLNTGGATPEPAYYSTGSGTDALTFLYTVTAGDTISTLAYWSEWALELNGGRIWDIMGNDAILTLPAPGTPGSLSGSIVLSLDTDYPVYRFYSPVLLKHLFTIDENEKQHLIDKAADVWRFENIAYYAFHPLQYNAMPRLQKNTLQAVHRFYSEALLTHLFTTDENEKEHLIANAADVWRYEGPAFYVPTDYQDGMLPVHRFYSENLKVHLFTVDENEKASLIANAAEIWRYEGIAYYVFP
ncbi:FG-GAP-like repeat-containing protein [Desulfococcaceae bacterium HSG9]|nr:FG-GAP-like repeat-containing protein [Desulfococcaceae bacterium HSG9]